MGVPVCVQASLCKPLVQERHFCVRWVARGQRRVPSVKRAALETSTYKETEVKDTLGGCLFNLAPFDCTLRIRSMSEGCPPVCVACFLVPRVRVSPRSLV